MAPSLLALTTVLFCWKLVFGGLVVIGYDTMTYMYPYRFFAAEALKAGRVPLWNPHIYFGAPFLANLQSAVFYPLHALFLIAPEPWGMNWSVVVHLFLCTYFGYLAARTVLRIDALSAAVAGALYGLSGFVGAQVGHLNQLNAAAWLPLALATLHCALTRRSWRWVATTAGVLGVQLLAGHAQETYMTLTTLGGYAAFHVVHAGVSTGLAGRSVWPAVRAAGREALWSSLALGASGGLAGGIAAAQLLPSVELTAYSIRATGMSFGEAASFSLPPRELFVGLLPAFGLAAPTSNEYLGWIGFSGLALMLFAVLFRVRRPAVLFFFVLALVSFMLALGDHFPVYEYAFRLPGVRLFRVPARWLMLTTLSDAMLAGAGLAFIRQLGSRGWTRGDLPAPAGPWQRLIAATRLLLALAIVGGAAAVLWPFQKPGPGTVPAQLTGVWLGVSGGVAALSFWALAMAPSRLPGALFAVVTFGELFIASRPLEYNNPNPPSVYTEARPVHEALARASGPEDRYVSIAATGYHPSDAKELVTGYEARLGEGGVLATLINTKYKEILTPNLPMVYGFRSVDGYDGGVLPLRRYVDYKRLLLPAEQNVPDALLRDQLHQMPGATTLRALGATYVLADAIGDVTRDGVYYDLGGTITLGPQESVTLRHLGIGDGRRGPLSGVGIVTSLTGAGTVADGEIVATVTLRAASAGETGPTVQGQWQGTLIAGQDTAEGAYSTAVRHRQPAPLGPAGSGGSAAATYLANLAVPAGVWAESVVIHNVLRSGSLRVQGLTLTGDGGAQWPVALEANGDLALIHRSDVKLYRDDRPVPRAYVVPGVTVVDGLDGALGALADGRAAQSVAVLERAPFDPPPSAGLRGMVRRLRDAAYEALGVTREVVPGALGDGDSIPAPARTRTPDERTSVRWVEDGPEHVRLQVTAPAGGMLVVRDTFYPGWSVTVDGSAVAPLRADILFRAVPLPGGSLEPHEVAFTFRSRAFERGALISILALAVTLVVGVFPLPRWSM